MRFWDLFRGEAEKVRIKDLHLTYYEIMQILNKEDVKYQSFLSSKDFNKKQMGSQGRLLISKLKKKFKSFTLNKYEYNKKNKK